jgi:hypothetical protein
MKEWGLGGKHRHWNLKVLRVDLHQFVSGSGHQESGSRNRYLKQRSREQETGRPLTGKRESMKTKHTAKQANRKQAKQRKKQANG